MRRSKAGRREARGEKLYDVDDPRPLHPVNRDAHKHARSKAAPSRIMPASTKRKRLQPNSSGKKTEDIACRSLPLNA
jgi:hypothetical protein